MNKQLTLAATLAALMLSSCKPATQNTIEEQEHYIVSYTKIITDVPGFHKDLEKYEIYNGRKALHELKEIIFSRFAKINLVFIILCFIFAITINRI